jgi:3-oxoacyl-[acyl-carrier protein] reductase
VNWRGAFASVRAFKSLLAEGNGGLVVNISSVAGQTGIGSNVAYCASKAAMDAMTKSLARALAPQIRVVSVSPGWVEAHMPSASTPQCWKSNAKNTTGAHRTSAGRCGRGTRRGNHAAIHDRQHYSG